MEATAERELKYETAFAMIRLVLGLGALIAFVSLIGWRYRGELMSFGEWFVDRFGVAGMIAGTALADGIHFPLPPQFYLLTGIAGGYGGATTFLAVLVGSEIGSFVAYSIGRYFGQSRWVDRRMTKPRKLLERVLARQGYLGLAIASLLPISFCILCLTAGAMRLPYRAFGLLAAMRIPKVFLSYAVIVLAWHS
ncbi:MAG: VTT domain-containing protein [Labilithrix sp.]|nr:VTT domain-containing protein [Labilithrix sp.]